MYTEFALLKTHPRTLNFSKADFKIALYALKVFFLKKGIDSKFLSATKWMIF